MAAVFVASLIVAFTWLATVRWARFGEEPRDAASVPAGAPQGVSCGSRDTGTPPSPAEAVLCPRPSWARTDKEAA